MSRVHEAVIDRPRKLRFTVQSLRALKREAGRTLAVLFLELTGLDMDAFVLMLWAALNHHDESPSIKVSEVEGIVQAYLDAGGSMEELGEIIEEAAVVSGILKREPPEEEGDGREGDPPKPPEIASGA